MIQSREKDVLVITSFWTDFYIFPWHEEWSKLQKYKYFNPCKLWEPLYLATWYTLGLFSFLVLLWVQIMVFQGTWINKTHLDIVVLLLLSRARDPCMSPSLRFAQRPRQYIIGLLYWYWFHICSNSQLLRRVLWISAMAVRVVEFSNRGYKIKKIFA